MFTEPLSAFFSAAEMADACTLNGAAVTAIFADGYALGSAGALGMASTGPRLTLPTTSVPANPVGLPAVMASTSYLVAAHEPDGTGISRLVWEAA